MESCQYEVDAVREKRLTRKLDLYIIPPVMLLYLFSFLDRYVHLVVWPSEYAFGSPGVAG